SGGFRPRSPGTWCCGYKQLCVGEADALQGAGKRKTAMIRIATHLFFDRSAWYRSAVVLAAGCAVALAQPPSGGWRRASDPAPPPAAVQEPQQVAQADAFGQPVQQDRPFGASDRPPSDRPMPAVPAELTLPAG